jgi:ammonia channel protein AmtB
VCQCQVLFFEHYALIDDPLSASGVHFGAGAAGMFFTAFFANPEYSGENFTGILYGGSWKFLGYQLMGMACYTSWTLATSGVMFYSMKFAGWLRVSEEEERLGVDKSHHGGSAYPLDDEHDAKKEPLTNHSDSVNISDDNKEDEQAIES